MELMVAKPVVDPTSANFDEVEDVAIPICKHKNKKGLYKLPEIRKKMKANAKKGQPNDVCEECFRNNIISDDPTQWLCVTCGFIGCEKKAHVQKHCQSDRTGVEHVLFSTLDNQKFKCFGCNLVMDFLEGPMKTFTNDYCAFKKTLLRRSSFSGQATEKKTSASKNDVNNEETLTQITVKGIGLQVDKNNSVKADKSDDVYGDLEFKNTILRSRSLAVKGLRNLGNTCFFNSTMQCLMHTYTLNHYVNYVGALENVDIGGVKVNVGDKQIEVPKVELQLESFYGSLNECFAHFIRDFGASRILDPSALFSEIAKKAPRFRGWAQQDAHELLRYLMDGLRTEELQRYKNAITSYLKVPKGATSKALGPDAYDLAKGMLKACGRPFLDAIFGGTLLQTIKCSNCGHLSCIYEEFLDLSIPIPSNSTSKFLNGALKIHKSPPSTLSKHQKKKEKVLARKRLRRKSRRESSSSCQDDVLDSKLSEETNVAIAQNESDLEEDVDAEISEKSELGVENLHISEDNCEGCLQTLGEELEIMHGNSLYSCLSAFTSEEVLSHPNAYECEKCCVPHNKNLRNGMKKKAVEAVKRYFIYEPPTVLTLHLKRFEQHHFSNGKVSTSKVRGHVDFPLVLDIASFATSIVKRVTKGSQKILYALYGVVSHSGDLYGGHYVAYVRSRQPSPIANKFFCEAARNLLPKCANINVECREYKEDSGDQATITGHWFYVSDNRVVAVDETKVLDAEAYILFYERIA